MVLSSCMWGVARKDLTQPAGDVHIRNFRLPTTPDISASTSKVIVTNDIVCSRAVSCVPVVQTSDRRIKEGTKDASLDDLQAVFATIPTRKPTHARKSKAIALV